MFWQKSIPYRGWCDVMSEDCNIHSNQTPSLRIDHVFVYFWLPNLEARLQSRLEHDIPHSRTSIFLKDVPRARLFSWYLSITKNWLSTTKKSVTGGESDVRFKRYSNFKTFWILLFSIVFRPREGSLFSFVSYCFFDSLSWFLNKKFVFFVFLFLL